MWYPVLIHQRLRNEPAKDCIDGEYMECSGSLGGDAAVSLEVVSPPSIQ